MVNFYQAGTALGEHQRVFLSFIILSFCSCRIYFAYKIATITLILRKDKELVARPITTTFLMLLGDAYNVLDAVGGCLQ